MFMKDFTRTATAARVLPVTGLMTLPAAGLVAGTLVETATGWRRVESLARGDMLHTLDGGLRRIAALDRAWLLPEMGAHLLRLPGGTLDNCSDLTLLPGQHILTDITAADGIGDALTALLPAAALLGWRGTTRHAVTRPTEVVTPLFTEEEVVFANSGTLLYCPGVAEGAGRTPQSDYFTRLDLPAARALLSRRDAALAA